MGEALPRRGGGAPGRRGGERRRLIGFVGLVAPHLARLLIGPDYRFLLPASALLGAGLVVAADAAARIVATPLEFPFGSVLALLGAPYFLYLLWRGERWR